MDPFPKPFVECRHCVFLIGQTISYLENSKLLRGISVISLANSNLFGHIPNWMGFLTILESLHLNNNSLSGKIPSLRNCTELKVLDLGENNLEGNIPTWIGKSLQVTEDAPSSIKYVLWNYSTPAITSYSSSAVGYFRGQSKGCNTFLDWQFDCYDLHYANLD